MDDVTTIMELVDSTIINMLVLYEQTQCQYFYDQAQSWTQWRSMVLDDVKQKWSEKNVTNYSEIAKNVPSCK